MKNATHTLYDILRDPKKRRAWVIYQLSLQDKTLAGIAEKKGVNRQTVYKAFDQPYPKMEQLIADELGMMASTLFPERYTDGVPNRVMGRPKAQEIQEWLSAAELSGYPGIPASVQKINKKAKEENWQSQPRKGKGGGSEYRISDLPEVTQKAIKQEASTGISQKNKAQDNA